MLPALEFIPDSRWVRAAPFRAHLRHLCDTTSLPWPVLAMMAGMSLSLADHLLHGRNGRPLQRLARESAARLLTVTPEVAQACATEWVAGDEAVRLLDRLGERGWSPADLVASRALAAHELNALRGPAPHQVTLLTLLRLRAVVASLDRAAVHGAAA